jgi:hypothetical protein
MAGNYAHGPQALVPPCGSLSFGKASGIDQRREAPSVLSWMPSTTKDSSQSPVGRLSNCASVLDVGLSNWPWDAYWKAFPVFDYDVLSLRRLQHYWLLRPMIDVEVGCRIFDDLDLMLSGGCVLAGLLQGLEGEESG